MLYRSTRRGALSASTALNYGVLTLLARPECACGPHICPGHPDAGRRKGHVTVVRGGQVRLIPFHGPGVFTRPIIAMDARNDNETGAATVPSEQVSA